MCWTRFALCYIIVDHFCLAVRPSGRAAADNTRADGYPSFVPTINIQLYTQCCCSDGNVMLARHAELLGCRQEREGATYKSLKGSKSLFLVVVIIIFSFSFSFLYCLFSVFLVGWFHRGPHHVLAFNQMGGRRDGINQTMEKKKKKEEVSELPAAKKPGGSNDERLHVRYHITQGSSFTFTSL